MNGDDGEYDSVLRRENEALMSENAAMKDRVAELAR